MTHHITLYTNNKPIMAGYIRATNEEYSLFESKILYERIGYILQSIRFNVDNRFIYHDSYQLHSCLRKMSQNDIYSIQHRDWLISLTEFLEFSKNFIDFDFNMHDNEIDDVNELDYEYETYIQVDVWIAEIDSVIQTLEYIIDSFNYNYQDMKKKGESFYIALAKYVHHPDRIERISKYYNMDWDTYLDSIDL